METKQEVKSLPRNRKCGNCRYFEPAPLWRKGWCRNSKLYDRRANHLVDAATIDCEQVFRARIYWEPIPLTDEKSVNLGYSPFVGQSAADSGAANYGRVPADGILRTQSPVQERHMPVIQRQTTLQVPVQEKTRERAEAMPGLVAKPNRVRVWLRDNIPYYDKIDGPISRISINKALPWIIIAALLLIVALNLFGGNKDNQKLNTSNGTVTAGASATLGNQTTAPVVQSGVGKDGKPVATATPTLSSLVPTATPVPIPTATPVKTETFAKVVNAGKEGLRMRKEPNRNAAIIANILDGKEVKIRSANFVTADGITWWPISYEGQDGWASGDYLEKKT